MGYRSVSAWDTTAHDRFQSYDGFHLAARPKVLSDGSA